MSNIRSWFSLAEGHFLEIHLYILSSAYTTATEIITTNYDFADRIIIILSITLVLMGMESLTLNDGLC